MAATLTVPLVVGQTQAQAQTLITSAGLRVGQVSQVATLAVPPGTVVQQTPAPEHQGQVRLRRRHRRLLRCRRSRCRTSTGQTESAASATLAEQGLRIGTVSYVNDSSVAAGDITAQDPAAGKEVAVGSAVNITISKGKQQGQVPNVVGLAQSDAESTLEGAGFKSTSKKTTSSSVPAGDVISQSPAAGVVTAAGSTVTITVSTGAPAPTESALPNVVGLAQSEAESTLEGAGFKSTAKQATSSSVAAGDVISQSPAAGVVTAAGSTVTITVSSGAAAPEQPATPETPPADKPSTKPEPSQVSVPDLIGMRVIEALGTLRKANLKFKIAWDTTDKDILLVIAQDPDAGTEVDPGTAVEITIGLPSFSFEKPAAAARRRNPRRHPRRSLQPVRAVEPRRPSHRSAQHDHTGLRVDRL